MGLRGDAAIVGVAEFAPERKPSKRWMGLAAQAELARLALDDAGIPLGDVNGLITQSVLGEAPFLVPSTVVEYLGIGATFAEVVDLGGATGCAMALRAAMAIEAGFCDVCVCITDMTMRPPDPRPTDDWAQDWGGGAWGSPQAEFEIPFGAIQGTYGYAMIANRYRHEYGLDPRHLAKIAVDQRTNAQFHPKAFFRGQPITIEDVLNSRLICDPLRLLEIVMPCWGGAAFVVASKERARSTNRRPVNIIGAGEYVTHRSVTYARSLTHSTVKAAADRAFAMAGVKRSEIDMAQIYDCYTITALLTIEDAGFAGKGDGGKFVAAHDLTWGGDFPMNTHGGQLSFGQSGGAGGTSHIVEAVLQIQGRAEGRQVPHCDTVYVNGNGGIMSEQASLVLRGD